MRLTQEQLAAMRDAQDWSALWAAALPWVKFVVSSIKTDDPEDLLQEVLLKIGVDVPKWDPLRGPFSQFIMARARFAAYGYVKRARRDARVTADLVSAEPLDAGQEAPEAGYGDAGYTPHGYGDAAQELARIAAPRAAEALLRRLDPATALRLRERWGLPVFDSEGAEETSVPAMAAAYGVPRESLRDVLTNAQKSLARGQSEPHVRHTGAIYAPPGKTPLPEYMPGEDRHPGFWHGLAGAMGDVSAWRESIGSVWRDWSWKPTYSDIKNGCKP